MVSQPSPAYIHTLTTAFASTLDEIPQDMCRHFADLRELDAVLSQSLSGITKRIEELTQRIEGGLASLSTLSATAKGQTESSPDPATEEEVISMFQLLHEIADDTGRIKLGGEDKIRVASLAAEHMNAYHSHLLSLVRKMHNIDSAYAPEILSPHTLYPHVPPSALVDPPPENRRGAPRRTAATYGQLSAMSAQGQNGAYNSSHRNESTGRGVNGDTPSKRRRVQPPIASSSVHNSQLQGPRADRDMDTDDYSNSTPRRGVSALDAEAYRPGGTTANRARTHGRKGRDGGRVGQNSMLLDANGMPIPMDGNGSSRGGLDAGPSRLSGNGMQGTEPGTTNHSQTNGVSSHKSQLQNGRSRGGSSQHHRTNPNPQPQHYPMHYQPYGERSHVPGNPFVDPSTGYGSMGPSSYSQTANLNPLMDAAAAYHNNAMNMNPNLNHLPSSANYPNTMGMGMVIPTSLPPPPGTAHGRPSSASMSGRNSYDVLPPRSAGNSRQGGAGAFDGIVGGSSVSNSHGNPLSKSNSMRVADPSSHREAAPEREYNVAGNGSSASGGLMPLPMFPSLPSTGVLTHSSHAPHSSYVDPTLPRSRGYSSTQGYSGNSYGAPEPNQNPLPPPASHHPHTTYTSSSHPSSLPSAHTSQPGYASNATSNPTATDKAAGKPDVHPSLVTSSLTKDPLPSSLHSRGPSVPTSAGGSSTAIHGSLATRDAPYWSETAGPAERFERDVKSNAPSRPRSSTVDGGTPATAASGNPSRYRDEPVEQRPAPTYERISPSVEQRDRDRENATLAGQASHQPSAPIQSTGGPGPSTYSSQSSLPPVSGQGPLFGPGEKMDAADRLEDRDVAMADAAGSAKPPALPDRLASERERERERQGAEVDTSKGEGDSTSRDGPEKAIKTPTRRKTGEDGPFTFDSSSPFKFGEGASGEITEGQTVDEDSKPYCICGRPSFGQMIGCDDSECEFEWFHLQCLGITGTPPQGEFVCPTCKTRRAKGSRRPQKKKSTVGGRGRGM